MAAGPLLGHLQWHSAHAQSQPQKVPAGRAIGLGHLLLGSKEGQGPGGEWRVFAAHLLPVPAMPWEASTHPPLACFHPGAEPLAQWRFALLRLALRQQSLSWDTAVGLLPWMHLCWSVSGFGLSSARLYSVCFPLKTHCKAGGISLTAAQC